MTKKFTTFFRSACCGSLTAMISAIQYLRTGYYKTIAVCGCDVGSIFGNLYKDSPVYERQDFVNAIMIGDGAGAAILRGFTVIIINFLHLFGLIFHKIGRRTSLRFRIRVLWNEFNRC